MSPVGVFEAARALRVTPQRVRTMLATGRLTGSKISGIWLIDLPLETDAALRPQRRPLSPTRAWHTLAMLSGTSTEMDPSTRYKLRHRLRAAFEEVDGDPVAVAGLLRAWFVRRAADEWYNVLAVPLAQLRADSRVYAGGTSHPDSPLRDAATLDAYVLADDVPALVAQYAMVPAAVGTGDVRLRVVSDPVGVQLLQTYGLPPAAVAVDLAELDEVRAIHEAARMLERIRQSESEL